MSDIVNNIGSGIFNLILKKIFRWFEKPVLDLNLFFDSCQKVNRGMLGESGKTYDIGKGDMPIMCEFVWNYKLEIRNNSSHTAYRVKIAEQNPQSNTMKIDFPTVDVTIKTNEPSIVDCIITHCQKMTARESSRLFYNEENYYPFFLEDDIISITISYTNESKRRFYSQICINKDSDILMDRSMEE